MCAAGAGGPSETQCACAAGEAAGPLPNPLQLWPWLIGLGNVCRGEPAGMVKRDLLVPP
jgi:hypothetical protein